MWKYPQLVLKVLFIEWQISAVKHSQALNKIWICGITPIDAYLMKVKWQLKLRVMMSDETKSKFWG